MTIAEPSVVMGTTAGLNSTAMEVLIATHVMELPMASAGRDRQGGGGWSGRVETSVGNAVHSMMDAA